MFLSFKKDKAYDNMFSTLLNYDDSFHNSNRNEGLHKALKCRFNVEMKQILCSI